MLVVNDKIKKIKYKMYSIFECFTERGVHNDGKVQKKLKKLVERSKFNIDVPSGCYNFSFI